MVRVSRAAIVRWATVADSVSLPQRTSCLSTSGSRTTTLDWTTLTSDARRNSTECSFVEREEDWPRLVRVSDDFFVMFVSFFARITILRLSEQVSARSRSELDKSKRSTKCSSALAFHPSTSSSNHTVAMSADNPNPTVFAAPGARRTKRRMDLSLEDDDDWERLARQLDDEQGDDDTVEDIDGDEIFGEYSFPPVCYRGSVAWIKTQNERVATCVFVRFALAASYSKAGGTDLFSTHDLASRERGVHPGLRLLARLAVGAVQPRLSIR